jgi:hypothetical protein
VSASGNNSDVNGNPESDTVDTPSGLANHSESWALNLLGNWNSFTKDGGSVIGRTHNSKNELTTVASAAFTFDNNGNTTTDNSGRMYI